MRGPLLVVAVAVAALAGCATASTPPGATVHAASVSATPSAPARTAAVGTPFTSAQYGYSASVPAPWSVEPATTAWDGGDVDHTADYADRFTDAAGNVYFVLGARTDADSAAYADQHLGWLSAERGCPDPSLRTTITVDGERAERVAVHCPDGVFGPTLVSKVIAVHDGRALIVTAFSPDAGADAFPPLDDLVSTIRWTGP